MKFWISFFLTLLRRKKKIILSFFLIFILAGSAGYYLFTTQKSSKLTQGLVGTNEERDLPVTVLNLLSMPLIRIDKSGLPQPELAQSWEVNPEATAYKVKLKPDLYWSDGTKLLASQIYISIPDVEITAPDDLTLEFKLAETFSPFLTLLNKPILRKAQTSFGFELVGVGPFSVDKIKYDGPFVKKLELISSDKNLPLLTIKFFPNERIAKTALKLGEVQVVHGLNDIKDLDFKYLNETDVTNYKQIVTIFFNTQDPVLSDENFRLGLAFGAPEIPGEDPANTSLSPYSWAYNPTVKDYLNNPQKAQEYLKKVEKGKEDTIILTATSSLEDAGQKVIEAWNELGIKSVLRTESGTPQNFQALLITQDIPADPDQYKLWHSTQKESTNISKIASPRIDKDLEDGRKITDLQKRKQKYQDFQKILLDEAPAIFLYFPKYHVVYMKKVQNQLEKVLPIQLSNLN